MSTARQEMMAQLAEARRAHEAGQPEREYTPPITLGGGFFQIAPPNEPGAARHHHPHQQGHQMSNEEFAADIRATPVTGGHDVDLSRPLAQHLTELGYRKRPNEEDIERAAKALHDLGLTALMWDERDGGLKELYREDARAVIAALWGGEA